MTRAVDTEFLAVPLDTCADAALGRARLPRRFWSHIALVVGEPVPPAQATAAILEAKVRELRGDWA